MKAYVAGKPILSTTDWPSNVCCVVFFVGCNLRCRFCFNTPLLEFDKKYQVDLTRIYQEIEANRFLLDGVIVTGGEPTLQQDSLRAIAEWTREHNLMFGLMTNGTKPTIIQELLDANLLDYIAVDIKTVPNATEYAKITQTTQEILPKVKKTIAIIKSSNVSYEFRTTLVPSLVYHENQLRQILDWVGPNHYVLQTFRPTDTVLDPELNASFSSEELEKFRTFARENNLVTRF
jgi:pyruvate formate lyase activating enzyme